MPKGNTWQDQNADKSRAEFEAAAEVRRQERSAMRESKTLGTRIDTVITDIGMLSNGPVLGIGRDRSDERNEAPGVNSEFEIAHFPAGVIQRHLSAILEHTRALERTLDIHRGNAARVYTGAGHYGYEGDLSSADTATKDKLIVALAEERNLSPEDIARLGQGHLGSPRAVAKTIAFARRQA